jgi:hypothetical protein
MQDHGGGKVLSKGWVLDPETGSFRHSIMSEQAHIYFCRRYLLPTPVHDLFHTALKEKISIGIQVAKISSPEPTSLYPFLHFLWKV